MPGQCVPTWKEFFCYNIYLITVNDFPFLLSIFHLLL